MEQSPLEIAIRAKIRSEGEWLKKEQAREDGGNRMIKYSHTAAIQCMTEVLLEAGLQVEVVV